MLTQPRTQVGATPRSRVETRDPIRGAEVLRTLGTWLILAAVVGFLTWWLVAQLAPGWQSANEPALLIAAEVYAALPLAMLLTLGGWSGVRDRLGLHFTTRSDLGLSLGVWFVAFASSAVVYVLATPLMGPPLQVLDSLLHIGTDITRFPTATPVDLVLILVRAIFLAGLAEELLYRGLLFGWLRSHLSDGPVIAITSALFALQHFYAALMIVAFLYAVGAGWIRARTGSTLNTLVMHVLSDSLLLVLALLTIGVTPH
jgi:membrane protease YdiL (CAAX protease family)